VSLWFTQFELYEFADEIVLVTIRLEQTNDWPTFQFVGGLDVFKDVVQSGEFPHMLGQ